MKRFITLALVANMIIGSAFAGVKEDVAALGKLAFGYNVTKVTGKTAKEILTNFVAEEEELVYKEYQDMDFGDEVDEGFTSIKSAKLMGGFAASTLEELLENEDSLDNEADQGRLRSLRAKSDRLAKNWSPLIQKLADQGVKFGYTGNGPGYCGVSFVELIIVDQKENKVYEVYLSEAGEC